MPFVTSHNDCGCRPFGKMADDSRRARFADGPSSESPCLMRALRPSALRIRSKMTEVDGDEGPRK